MNNECHLLVTDQVDKVVVEPIHKLQLNQGAKWESYN